MAEIKKEWTQDLKRSSRPTNDQPAKSRAAAKLRLKPTMSGTIITGLSSLIAMPAALLGALRSGGPHVPNVFALAHTAWLATGGQVPALAAVGVACWEALWSGPCADRPPEFISTVAGCCESRQVPSRRRASTVCMSRRPSAIK